MRATILRQTQAIPITWAAAFNPKECQGVPSYRGNLKREVGRAMSSSHAEQRHCGDRDFVIFQRLLKMMYMTFGEEGRRVNQSSFCLCSLRSLQRLRFINGSGTWANLPPGRSSTARHISGFAVRRRDIELMASCNGNDVGARF